MPKLQRKMSAVLASETDAALSKNLAIFLSLFGGQQLSFEEVGLLAFISIHFVRLSSLLLGFSTLILNVKTDIKNTAVSSL